jgi:hypothetical protein
VFNCTYPSLGNPYMLDMSEPYKAAVLEELLVRFLCICCAVECASKPIETALYTLLEIVLRYMYACARHIKSSTSSSLVNCVLYAMPPSRCEIYQLLT